MQGQMTGFLIGSPNKFTWDASANSPAWSSWPLGRKPLTDSVCCANFFLLPNADFKRVYHVQKCIHVLILIWKHYHIVSWVLITFHFFYQSLSSNMVQTYSCGRVTLSVCRVAWILAFAVLSESFPVVIPATMSMCYYNVMWKQKEWGKRKVSSM